LAYWEAGPLIVFNLVDAIEGDGRLAPRVPARLDAFGIAYTLCEPTFIVRIFVNDAIAIAVWTSFDTTTIAAWISFWFRERRSDELRLLSPPADLLRRAFGRLHGGVVFDPPITR
jgi:hypothetical protein